MKKLLVLFCVCLLILQCGYHLRGVGGFLPSHIKKISIPMFENLTTRFELDLTLTQSVIDEMVARSDVEVTGDTQSADAVLVGELSSFNVNPIAFSGEATADRYNITIVADIKLRDLVYNKIIFSNPKFVYKTEYEVSQGTDFETVETEAIQEISQKFARSLVMTMLEGF
ncbi:LptE family protein [bacterium]|nr:LptE family protein [bacterium]